MNMKTSIKRLGFFTRLLDETDAAERYRLATAQIVQAEKSGFDSAWIAQHRSLGAETRVLIETTTLDVRSGEPAIAHIRAGFASGAHVITANKGPIAFAYRAANAAHAETSTSI